MKSVQVLALASGAAALTPRLAEMWGNAGLGSAAVLDSDGCWTDALKVKRALGVEDDEDLFVPVTTEKPTVWTDAVMTYNEPASCFVLEMPANVDGTNRILVIEGESEQEGQAYCVEDLGAPDLPGTSVPVEPTCGEQVAFCGHITTDRITKGNQGSQRIKIRFSCRESCAEGDYVPYKFRAYLSEETYAIEKTAPKNDDQVQGSDILDQFCDATIDFSEFPSAQRVADCSTGFCPELTDRIRGEAGSSAVVGLTGLWAGLVASAF